MSYTANGLRATTYRTVYDKDGNEISRTVEANSTYHSHDTTPKPTPTPTVISRALRSRWPWVMPSVIIAATGANRGTATSKT